MNPEENNNPLNTGAPTSPTPTVPPTPAAPAEPATPAAPVTPATPAASPTEPTAPFGAVDSIPTESDASSSTATDESSPSATFAEGDAAEKAAEEVENLPPIEPSEPLPGSIGSAVSGPAANSTTTQASPAQRPAPAGKPFADFKRPVQQPTPAPAPTPVAPVTPTPAPNAADLAATETPAPAPAPVPMNDHPKKKVSALTIILIILALAVIAAGVVAYFLMTQQAQQEAAQIKHTQETPAVAQPVETALVCVAAVEDSEQLAKIAPDSTKYTSTITAKYTDGEFSQISSREEFTFADSESATNYATIAQANYTDTFINLGLQADPFDSAFRAQDAIVSALHTATADQLKTSNMALFALKANSEDKVDTAYASIQATYEGLSLGYKCTYGDYAESQKVEETPAEQPIVEPAQATTEPEVQ